MKELMTAFFGSFFTPGLLTTTSERRGKNAAALERDCLFLDINRARCRPTSERLNQRCRRFLLIVPESIGIDVADCFPLRAGDWLVGRQPA